MIKTLRKAAQIAYSSLRSDAVFTCSLLFQALVHVNSLAPLSFLHTTTIGSSSSSSSRKKSSASESHNHSRWLRHAGTPTIFSSAQQQQQEENLNYQQATLIDDAEFEKSRLHLALGRLITEHAADAVSVQSSAQQQSMLASLFRKSHFKGDQAARKSCSNWPSWIAVERKYAQPDAQATAKLSLDERLFDDDNDVGCRFEVGATKAASGQLTK